MRAGHVALRLAWKRQTIRVGKMKRVGLSADGCCRHGHLLYWMMLFFFVCLEIYF